MITSGLNQLGTPLHAQSGIDGLTHRCLVRTVRVGEIELVGNVVDIQLHAEGFRHIEINGGVETGVAWQLRSIRLIDKAVVLVRQPETQTDSWRYLIRAPN